MRDGGGDQLEDARAGGSVTELGRLLALSLVAFWVFGLWAGCAAVLLLADLSRALGLSPGPLGVALFSGAGASMAAMASLGWTAVRYGRGPFLVAVTCVFGLGTADLAVIILSLRAKREGREV